MKRKIPILIILLSILACNTNNNKKEQLIEKPIQHFLSFRLVDNEFVEYDLDSLNNFNQVLKIIDEIDCRKEYALFKLETDHKIYKIQPLQYCENIFDFRLREILYLNLDSITVNYDLKYPIDSLQVVLNRHINNQDNDKNYPSNNQKKLISINIDDKKDIAETKNLLLKIITNINKIENTEFVSFMFEKHGIFPQSVYE